MPPHSHSAEELLQPLSPAEEAQYYSEVLSHAGCSSVVVRQTADGRGKGLFATRDLREGELIFREPPLAAIQHSASRSEALVCGRCFRFLGPLELQAAWLLRSDAEVPEELVSQLRSGELRLPGSADISLPSPVACTGRCEELYCSQACADADWREQHSLLCPGEASPSARQPSRRRALEQFCLHAAETNDIFLLAAKVLAAVLVAARAALAAAPQGEGADPERCWQTLRAAWRPFAAGWKAVWWECVATPEDVKGEAAFRQELKELAADSLELLAAALGDERFPQLFCLRLYGAIVGMFELNNLGLSVASPLQDWLEARDADGQASGSKQDPAVEAVAERLEGALEEGGDCEGTGFYRLQSCANHSCGPSAAAATDGDGAAVVTAKRALAAGEEVTISYIDESLPLDERTAALRDYGFVCGCARCAAERGGGGGGGSGGNAP